MKYKIDTLEKKAAENEAILKQLEKFYQSLLDKERTRKTMVKNIDNDDDDNKGINKEQIPSDQNSSRSSNQKTSQKGALNVLLNKVISKAVSYENQCPWVNDLKSHNADIEVLSLFFC